MESGERGTAVRATLEGLGVGAETSAVVRSVGGEGALRQHLLDMGVLPGARVEFVKRAPMGDPIEFRIRDYELTLRQAEAALVVVEPLDPVEPADSAGAPPDSARTVAESVLSDAGLEHPGLGEGGRFHFRDDENPLPPGTPLTFALAGNQNCGKTTLFNRLTGANQRVGNFPGVTVDRKEGPIRGRDGAEVVDLPGIYSLSPYSSEEVVSREYILSEQPTGIINIVDATNLERNLYLTMQLMELGVPMVLALNMMDEVQASGGSIRINELEAALVDAGAGEVVRSLIVEGVFDGVGTVLLFLPIIVVAVALGFALRHTAFKGEAVPFVMELPNYRRPTARNVSRLVWDKSRDFAVRAFTVILVATMVVWFLQSFSLQLELVDDPADSLLAFCAYHLLHLFGM